MLPAIRHPRLDPAVTIVLYREQTVIANFAFRRGELAANAAARVLKAIKRLASEDAAGGR